MIRSNSKELVDFDTELERRYLKHRRKDKHTPELSSASVKEELLKEEMANQQEDPPHESETLYETWEHFKESMRKCPYHGILEWLLGHIIG